MQGVKRAMRYLWRYWKPASGALVSLLLVNIANLAAPQLLRILIDEGISKTNLQRILAVAGMLVLVAVGRGVFNFLQGYWSEVASQGVAFELRNEIFNKLQKLSFAYHDAAQTGKLMTRMTSDVEMTRFFVGSGLIQLLSAIFLLVGTLVILFSMNALLTTIFLLMLPFIGVLFAIFVRKVMPLSKVVQEKLGALNTVLQENLAGIRRAERRARRLDVPLDPLVEEAAVDVALDLTRLVVDRLVQWVVARSRTLL
jgi:ATP-binding cassette subfamily B protein